jgi:hypothetical protein
MPPVEEKSAGKGKAKGEGEGTTDLSKKLTPLSRAVLIRSLTGSPFTVPPTVSHPPYEKLRYRQGQGRVSRYPVVPSQTYTETLRPVRPRCLKTISL